jgi:hypothetical protein
MTKFAARPDAMLAGDDRNGILECIRINLGMLIAKW